MNDCHLNVSPVTILILILILTLCLRWFELYIYIYIYMYIYNIYIYIYINFRIEHVIVLYLCLNVINMDDETSFNNVSALKCNLFIY